MSILYIDASMGITGAKLLGALIGCLERPGQFIGRFNDIGFEGIRLESSETAVRGISGRIIEFKRSGQEDYEDEIDEDMEPRRHRSHHRHVMRALPDVAELIDELSVSGRVRRRAAAVYEMMAEADAKVSGEDMRDVILHRTGSRDVIASVVGVFMALEELNCDKILSSPIAVGSGRTRTSKGETDIPIPVIAELLDGIPSIPGTESFEMCTAEGVALIKSIAESFGEAPEISAKRSGAGFGTREYQNGVNCVRAEIGDIAVTAANAAEVELESELYGESGAAIDHMLSRLLDEGVRDAYTLPIVSAVNGRGVLLKVICAETAADDAARCILANTSAASVRRRGSAVYELDAEDTEILTSMGKIRMKQIEGYGIRRIIPSREDTEAAAERNGISYAEAYERIKREAGV